MNSHGGCTTPALCCFLVVLMGCALVTPAEAEEDATRVAARALGTEGVNAYLDGDYALAHDRLESAYAVLRVPSLALWSARTLEKNGKLVEASERYLQATQLAIGSEGKRDVQVAAQKDAALERSELLARIPQLTIYLEGREPEDVELSVCGETVSSEFFGRARPTNPGQAEVIARSGSVVRRQTLDLAEGQSLEVTFQFPPRLEEPQKEARGERVASTVASAAALEVNGSRADASPSWQRPVGWVGIGVGASGIALGAVTGALALRASQEFDCEDKYCPNATDREIASYNTQRTLSSIGFVAGGVIAGAGLTLLLSASGEFSTSGKRSASGKSSAPKKGGASAAAFFTPSSLGIRGDF